MKKMYAITDLMALGAGYVYLFRVLIGSLYCLMERLKYFDCVML